MSRTRPPSPGHRKRLRARVERAGLDALADYELLELILGLARRRGDVKDTAKALLATFGGFGGVLDAGEADLQDVLGVGTGVIRVLRTVKAACTRYLEDRAARGSVAANPDLVADYCRARFAGEAAESFVVLCLDSRHRVRRTRVLSQGTVDRAAVFPREVASEALVRRAAAVIVVHNHPSGCPAPSPEDRRITQEIARALDALGVRLLDHVIVGREGRYSFREAGELMQ